MLIFDNNYTDLNDTPSELTESELSWFQSIVSRFQRLPEATGIEIKNADHEKLDRKNREAYGIFWKPTDENSGNNLFITIDNFFIHEMYEVEFHNDFNLTGETLQSCIAHEIAHFYQFRHCKRHKRITEEILQKYNSLPD